MSVLHHCWDISTYLQMSGIVTLMTTNDFQISWNTYLRRFWKTIYKPRFAIVSSSDVFSSWWPSKVIRGHCWWHHSINYSRRVLCATVLVGLFQQKRTLCRLIRMSLQLPVQWQLWTAVTAVSSRPSQHAGTTPIMGGQHQCASTTEERSTTTFVLATTFSLTAPPPAACWPSKAYGSVMLAHTAAQNLVPEWRFPSSTWTF